MKWIIFALLLGVAEIWIVGQLHPVLGTMKLVGLYLLTTAVGAMILLIRLPRFRVAFGAMSKLEKKWKNKFQASDFQPNADDLLKLRPIVFVSVYFTSAVLLIIPGIVSDAVGIVLATPMITDWYLDYSMRKAERKCASKKFIS